MKRAAIIVKLRGDELQNIVTRTFAILDKYNIEPLIEEDTAIRFNLDIKPCTIQEMRSKADFVIVLGGDGTLLYASRAFRLISIPILAFNLGRLGFIMGLELDDFETLIIDAIKEKLNIKRRMKLLAEIYEGENLIYEEEVLNEVVINKGGPSRMLDLSVYIDGEHVTRFRSDGIIIATPTGSTGYTISAGGPIVHPDLDTIILSPICPHALNVRPIVVPQTSEIVIKVETKDADAFITFDGQVVRPYKECEELRVHKSTAYAYIAMNQNRSYYETLRKKLGWGGELC